MITLLDCIERIPSIIERILAKQDEAFAVLEAYVKEQIERIDEIVFIGSGTSNTAAMTSQPFVEKASGIRTKVVYPNDYMEEGRVYNPNALHVFTSQTGTSTVVCKVMEKLSSLGCLCVSFTDSEESRLAKLSSCHVCINCGEEEYGMRTIGYTASVLNHMLMAMKLGRLKGTMTQERYDELQRQAGCIPESHRLICENTKGWFQKNKRQMMRSRCIIFTGAGMFYGLALESAVKFWEMPQVISMGYELEEGLHGPNYGYDHPHCVIVFNDGGKESDKALSLARYMKDVYHNGLVVGAKTVDEKDLVIESKAGEFAVLEYSAVPQVTAYFLTIDGGRDLMQKTDHSVMNSYFRTHKEVSEDQI